MSIIGKIGREIGEEVAEGLAKKAAPVVKKAAKNVDDNLEDWVFKKKPNEMSGNEYLKKINYAGHGFGEGASLNRNNSKALKDKWAKQLGNDPILGKYPNGTALLFSKLEDANIPRKYTGKLAKALLKDDNYRTVKNTESFKKRIQDISNGLKGMNESQRETLISLLPEWDFSTSSADDLVRAAKLL